MPTLLVTLDSFIGWDFVPSSMLQRFSASLTDQAEVDMARKGNGAAKDAAQITNCTGICTGEEISLFLL